MKKIQNPTLVCGIGGTGSQIVSKIKNNAYQEGIDENTTAFQTIVLDFDSYANGGTKFHQKFGENSNVSEKEHCYISENDVDTPYKKNLVDPGSDDDITYFDKDYQKGINEGDTEGRKKLTQNILDSNLNFQNGAGQVRINGKIGFSYSEHYEKVTNQLKELLEKLASNNITGCNDYSKITVIIISSTAGASGSGMLLDVLLMLNKIEVNRRVEIITINILPEPYVREYKNKVRKYLAYPNTYGAITELEYVYENIFDFRGTWHTEKGLNELRLPQINFLISDTAFGGGSAGNFSLKNIYNSVSRFAIMMISGQFDSDIKNIKTQSLNGKNSIFSSFGYSEVYFNINKLKDYAISKVLKLAETKINLKSNFDKGSFDPIYEGIKNILKEPHSNFLNSDFIVNSEKLSFKIPPLFKKQFKHLKNNININKKAYLAAVKKLVETHFSSEKFSNQINEAIQIIGKAENDVALIGLKKDFVKKLNEIILIESIEEKAKKEELSKKIDLIIKDINVIPRKKYKSFFGLIVKDEFYSVYLKDKINLLNTYLNDLKVLEINSELIRLINNLINTEAIPKIQNAEMLNLLIGYNLVNKNKSNTKLIEKSDNIIHLEAYFKDVIDAKITADTKIDHYYFNRLITTTSIQDFKEVLNHLDVLQYLNNVLDPMDILQLREELKTQDADAVEEIDKNLKYISNPLWNRLTDNEIANGGIGSGRFESHKWVAVPTASDKSQGYFGENFINGSSLPSFDKHRQSIYSVEIGLPAHAIKNIKSYKDEFEKEIKNNQDISIKFFVYDEIRSKCLNGDAGIYKIEDKERLELRKKAMQVWALGWAQGFIFKEDRRYKFNVGTDFKPIDSKIKLFIEGVYDPFKEFGQTNNLAFLFNKFCEEKVLIDFLEGKIAQEGDKNPKAFINTIKDRFEPTSSTNFVQKFKSEKKSYNNLNSDEKYILNEEEKTLANECEEFANDKGISIRFTDVKENDGKIYRRLLING